MRHGNRRLIFLRPLLALSLQLVGPVKLAAQVTDEDLAVIASWVAVDAPTGYESRLAPALASALSGWTADRCGNVIATAGTGSPHRLVACALDRPGYAVSQIGDDGYLRVHRLDNGARHPLWDQQYEAQQVRVLTASGPVAGSISPDDERSRVTRAAAAASIPLQIGLTQGGTDGTTFTFWGAPSLGLSWPGRYSHSPGEVLDMRDLDMLERLIVAIASGQARQL